MDETTSFDHGKQAGVEQLVQSGKKWLREAMDAWTAEDESKMSVLAPLGVEHLAKAALWREHPILITDLRATPDALLLQLVQEPNLLDSRLRTAGLQDTLRRLTLLVGALPVDFEGQKSLCAIRNGAMHVGSPAASHTALTDSLRLAQCILDHLQIRPQSFYGLHHPQVSRLLADRLSDVGQRVLARQTRAKAVRQELQDTYPDPDDLDAEIRRRMASAFDTPPVIFGEYTTHSTGWVCPICMRLARMFGFVEIKLDGASAETLREFEQILFWPDGFVCGICELELRGTDELQEIWSGLNGDPTVIPLEDLSPSPFTDDYE